MLDSISDWIKALPFLSKIEVEGREVRGACDNRYLTHHISSAVNKQGMPLLHQRLTAKEVHYQIA